MFSDAVSQLLLNGLLIAYCFAHRSARQGVLDSVSHVARVLPVWLAVWLTYGVVCLYAPAERHVWWASVWSLPGLLTVALTWGGPASEWPHWPTAAAVVSTALLAWCLLGPGVGAIAAMCGTLAVASTAVAMAGRRVSHTR
jgi:hypothetical protein